LDSGQRIEGLSLFTFLYAKCLSSEPVLSKGQNTDFLIGLASGCDGFNPQAIDVMFDQNSLRGNFRMDASANSGEGEGAVERGAAQRLSRPFLVGSDLRSAS
jgi:hypothetical protein